MHCRDLGIGACVDDDRGDVLRHLDGVVPLRLLFGPQRSGAAPAGTTHVRGWAEVVAVLLPLLWMGQWVTRRRSGLDVCITT